MSIAPYISQQPINDFGLRFSALFSATLAATTDTALTIPGTEPRYKAVIKVKNDTWVANNVTAAVPAGGSFASTNSELVIPSEALCREVKAGDVLHFFTSTASTDVSVALYALGSNN